MLRCQRPACPDATPHENPGAYAAHLMMVHTVGSAAALDEARRAFGLDRNGWRCDGPPSPTPGRSQRASSTSRPALPTTCTSAGRARGAIPFFVGRDGPRELVVALYRQWLLKGSDPKARKARGRLPELRGQRLGCYCAPLPCHGDVLAALADAGAGQ